MGMRTDVKRVFKRNMTGSTVGPPVDPAFKVISKTSTAFIIWRIENLRPVSVPKDQYGTFYEGDSYIIYAASEYGKHATNGMKAQEVRGKLEMHIHFWLGAETSQDESAVAAYKSVELDTYLGGAPVQHREVQGCESARFMAYFKNGIRLLKGGVLTGLHHVTDTFEPRLFRIKGRRIPVLRQMAAISWNHFNRGDVFIIDTKDVIFIWVGRSANNMEKLQATKVAIQLKDEHNAVSIVFVDDGKENLLPESEKLLLGVYLDLNSPARHQLADATEDDVKSEKMERAMLKLYKCSDEDGTYKVIEVKTGPLLQSDLNTNDSFIVDNGLNGIWVWVGRHASTKERMEAMRNAHGFVKKKNYPMHTPVCRVVESGEPAEFKALFSGWKEKDAVTAKTTIIPVKKTLPTKIDTAVLHESPKLAAETQLVDDGSGTICVWRVHQSELILLPPSCHGVFYAGDCYLVKYSYWAAGKERHILYYWLGLHSSVAEQTALALHTVAQDDALGGAAVQVRVIQSKEPPHFLAIFHGKMIVMSGDHKNSYPSQFLLQVRGNRTLNTKATQVVLRASSLNSNDVFVLKTTSACYVWCGKGSTGDEREMAKNIAHTISSADYTVVYEGRPQQFLRKSGEIQQPVGCVLYCTTFPEEPMRTTSYLKVKTSGQEKADFWNAIGGKEIYASNKRLAEPEVSVPARLFQCSNATGSFRVEEIINFNQTDLIPEDVMLLDAWDTIFLWIGDFSNREERKQAINLAINYLRTDPAGRDLNTPIVQLKQGHEPPTFTGFFGVWDPTLCKVNKSYEQMRQELEGQKPVLQVELKITNGTSDFEEYEKFPLHILKQRDPDKLPLSVDALHKELFLSKDDFLAAFGMAYNDFTTLPKWKQENLKKKVGLF